MASLSRGDVEHVAHLARLGLSDLEVERLRDQLDHILDQYALLAALDTDGIEPTAQVIELEGVLREDEPRASLAVAEALGNAREVHEGRVVVPIIIGGD